MSPRGLGSHMASQEQVKRYLAYWLQLGKSLVLDRGEILQPRPIEGDHYSREFEACWQRILAVGGENCYLEGTLQTLSDLLSETWDIADCARCTMPVPIVNMGVQPNGCPCFDLPTWPNTDLPSPRMPVDSRGQLEQIRRRLL